MPAIEKVYEKYKDRGLEVVSVNIENDAVRASSFAAAFKPRLTFPLFVDGGPAQAAFRVDAIPHLVLIDKDGRIAFVHVGGLGERGDRRARRRPRQVAGRVRMRRRMTSAITAPMKTRSAPRPWPRRNRCQKLGGCTMPLVARAASSKSFS